ncbi:MAG: galactose-1-epimerase [Streptococcaceae bacterium]|jgi:aldose 1-epimerase|nr:galactose-1-epimerase [Streptococcaceae bacterium]
MKINTKDFGENSTLITVENEAGVSISFCNLGARIVDWVVEGKNIVLGFDRANDYLEKDSYPGATIGRTAGRIKDGIVEISGKKNQLVQNEGLQTLHGGNDSFDKRFWSFETFNDGDVAGVHFDLISADGDNGYPGVLKVRVTYSFDEQNQWRIDYRAISDKDTVFNPTNHVYFNLTGDFGQVIDDHELRLKASRFVPLKDKTEVVRGDIEEVAGNDLDFRAGVSLAQALESQMEQVKLVGGIDHPFLLDAPGDLSHEQAHLSYGDLSVSVRTDFPSLVVFTANFGDAGVISRGKKIVNHGAITFEAQVSPGSEQLPELGNITLKAGEVYRATTIYQLTKEGN